MNIFKKALALLIILTLSQSCSRHNYQEELAKKEGFLRTRTDYNGYLALEYLNFSRNLYKNEAKADAKKFAIKGLAMAAGNPYIPENPIAWEADPQQLEELIAMQKRLELSLLPRIKTNLPIQTAHLSYLYDCWATKESQPVFRATELAKCRDKFYKLLGEIEYYIEDLRKDRTPKTIIFEPKFKKFEVFFDFNSKKLNNDAQKKMVEVVKHIESMSGDYKILLVGNTDRSGSKLYNQRLAFKRTQTVRQYLRKSGVPYEAMELRSYGEDFPDILTKDGTQKSRNRSVGIYILTGADSFDSFPLPLIENMVYKEGVFSQHKKRGL